VTLYNKTLFSQCNFPAYIEQVQDKIFLFFIHDEEVIICIKQVLHRDPNKRCKILRYRVIYNDDYRML
jgi:hypothetical protein